MQNSDKLQLLRWIGIAAIILLIGMVTTILSVRYTDRSVRGSLLSRAETIAAGIHVDEIKNLFGSPQDINRIDYNKIKQSMINIVSKNPDARFVYLMGFRDNKLFFYADSE